MAEATPQGNKLNVFISYSRDDLGFSDQLDAALGVTGFGTTLDRHGISGGEDWKRRLGNLIRDADTVVFVLSPSSARSEICAWEVGEAIRLGKRILPVLCRPLDGASPPAQLADLNYIFFYEEPRSPGSGFGLGLAGLVAALNTDLDWLREHTRCLQRASEWDAGGRPANRLLSGPDITSAKSWVASRPKAAPEPTALHLDFIRASEAEERRQQSAEAQRLRQLAEAQAEREAAFAERAAAQEREADARRSEAASQKREAEQARRVVRRTRAGLATAVVLAVAAGWFGVDASNQKDRAVAAATEATKQTARAQAYVAQIHNDNGRYFEAARAALAGLTNPLTLDTDPAQTAPWGELVRAAVADGFLVPPLRHDGVVSAATFDAKGERVVTASNDKTARIWDARTGDPIGKTLQHDGGVWAATFDAKGERVVTASEDKTARIWDARTGEPIGKKLQHADWVHAATFDAKGERVVTASNDKTARIWDARTGEPIGKTLQHDGGVSAATFDAAGERVVTASADKTARIWDARTGEPIGKKLQHHGRVNAATFDAAGERVVTASEDKTARIWDARTGEPIGEKLQHEGPVRAATFDAKGERVVTASNDKTARIWDARTGEPIGKTLQHEGPVVAATFDSKGERVVTASADKTARIWDARTGEPIGKTLQHDDWVWAATFDAAGARVVTASHDKTARIWDAPPAVGQALLDQVRATLGRKAPDPLKIPDQTTRLQSFVSVIGRGFSTIWTRLIAALS